MKRGSLKNEITKESKNLLLNQNIQRIETEEEKIYHH